MKAPRFEKWFAGLTLLNRPQRKRVQHALHPAAGLEQVIALIDKVRTQARRCPRCDCTRCYRHGHANDLQRYRCRDCGRTFNDLTGTPLARLRCKGKWLDYCAALLASCPIRQSAERVDVHRNTAFRWRHRFLRWVKLDRPQCLTGIVEADEMFLLESQKGSRNLDRPPRKRGGRAQRRGISRELDCILVARDRSGQTIDAVTGRGAVTVAQLTQHLLPKLDPQALLVSDANAAYRAFASKHRIAHQGVNLRAGQRVRLSAAGVIHVQNVNAYHQRFRQWLAPFRGVASRYLPNYLGWRWALDMGRIATVEQLFNITVKLIYMKR